MTIDQIIDDQMLAFNNRNIKNMMSLYSDEIKVFNFPDNTITVDGINECKKMFITLFDSSPKLYAEIINTITFDNKVIVHEYVYGRNGSDDKTEQIVIFEVNNQKITRMDLIRK